MNLFLRVDSVSLSGAVSVSIYGRKDDDVDKGFSVKKGWVYPEDVHAPILTVHLVDQKGAPPLRLKAGTSSEPSEHATNWQTQEGFQPVVHIPALRGT